MHGGAPPDLAELCEASGDRLLAHAISGEGCAAYQRNGVRLHGEENSEEIEALEEMLETLELSALYHWLGRNGEEAQKQRAAPAAATTCIAAAHRRQRRMALCRNWAAWALAMGSESVK